MVEKITVDKPDCLPPGVKIAGIGVKEGDFVIITNRKFPNIQKALADNPFRIKVEPEAGYEFVQDFGSYTARKIIKKGLQLDMPEGWVPVFDVLKGNLLKIEYFDSKQDCVVTREVPVKTVELKD